MIDYDGINYDASTMMQNFDKNMIKYLAEAMDDGEVDRCAITYGWVICGSCNGHGSNSRHLGAFTREEMHDLGDEFIETYLSRGYDRSCNACDGTGKVREIDYDSMPDSVKKWIDNYYDDANNSVSIAKSEWMAGA